MDKRRDPRYETSLEVGIEFLEDSPDDTDGVRPVSPHRGWLIDLSMGGGKLQIYKDDQDQSEPIILDDTSRLVRLHCKTSDEPEIITVIGEVVWYDLRIHPVNVYYLGVEFDTPEAPELRKMERYLENLRAPGVNEDTADPMDKTEEEYPIGALKPQA